MADPVKIVVTAETAQAAQDLVTFFKSSEAGFQELTVAAKQAAAALKTISAGPRSLPALSKGVAEAGKNLAGASYYFRSGIDSIRYAAAGGGARAGFYAIDEAVRGLISSGMSLSKLVPIIGLVTVAAAAGYAVWYEYTTGEREAEKAAKDLHEELEGLAKTYTQLKDLQKAGLLSPQAVNKYLDYLTGGPGGQPKVQLYKQPDGSLSTNSTSQALVSTGGYGPYGALSAPSRLQTVQLEKASAADVLKFIQEQVTVQGKLDKDSIDAKNKEIDLRKKIHDEAMSQAEQEIAKTHEKYQAERDEIQANAVLMKGLLTDGEKAANAKAIQTSLENEAREKADILAKITEEFTTKAAEANARGVAEFNKQLDDQLNASAAAQGKTREQIYQEEFNKRMALIELERDFEMLTAQQYLAAVEEATAKYQKGVNEDRIATQKLSEEIQRLQKAQSADQINGLLSNPYTSAGEKAAGLNPFIQQAGAGVAGAFAGMMTANDPREYLGYVQELNEYTRQYIDLLQKQRELSLQNSFKDQFAGAVQHLRDMNNLAQEIGQAFENVINTAISSISSNLTKVIEGTESWSQALQNIGSAILNEIIAAIVEMAVRWIVTSIMMAAFGEALMTSTAALYSAAWAGPAVLATIASFGAAAAAAPPEVMGALAFAPMISAEAIAAREHGGDVRAGLPYLVGERGKELVVPNEDAHVFNAEDTSRLLSSSRNHARSAASGAAPNVKIMVHLQDDPRRTEKDIKSNPDIHHFIINLNKRNARHILPSSS